MKCIKLILFISLFSTSSIFAQSGSLQTYQWGIVHTEENLVGRHENAFIEFHGKFYLIGGRGMNPVNVYDPITNIWETKSVPPLEIHHFQAVVYGNAIYIAGAMTGAYPTEQPLENIYIYYPLTDIWEKGPEIPVKRRRGSAGTVIDKGKIFIIGGIQLGHTSGTCSWVDSYDIKTGKWDILPDAPHIRDHFQSILINGKTYCVGGRNTSVHEENNFTAFFAATIKEVDSYDIRSKKWITLKENLPVGTAAGSLLYYKGRVIYMGGESGQERAHNQVQALDLKTGQWEQLNPLIIGCHGTGAVLYNDKIYIAAGSGNRGGGNMKSMQVCSDGLNWKSLFNGKNFDGWVIQSIPGNKKKDFWKVDNGTILCNSLGDPDHDHVWLQNEDEFQNFELRLKFQAYKESPGNSGVQIRSRYNENPLAFGGYWLDGPQVDIDPPTQWRTGLIYDETFEEKRWINPSLKNWEIDKSNAPEKVIFVYGNDADEWNDLIIVCRGNKIKTWLNNIIVTDWDGTGVLDNEHHVKRNVHKKGHIALQLHVKDQLKIRYKDIYIRELED